MGSLIISVGILFIFCSRETERFIKWQILLQNGCKAKIGLTFFAVSDRKSERERQREREREREREERMDGGREGREEERKRQGGCGGRYLNKCFVSSSVDISAVYLYNPCDFIHQHNP